MKKYTMVVSSAVDRSLFPRNYAAKTVKATSTSVSDSSRAFASTEPYSGYCCQTKERFSTRKCVVVVLIFIFCMQFLFNSAIYVALFFGSKGSELNDLPQLSSVSKVASYSPFSFSGCLIFKDDIRILPEWLAYHYTVMPLRRLVVTIDPLSIVSPEPIFEKFRELGMDITVWDDIDFNEGAKDWWAIGCASSVLFGCELPFLRHFSAGSTL